MSAELKLYEIKCGRCQTCEHILSVHKPSLPEGWTTESVGPCGLTDYYRDEPRCPTCSTLKEGDPTPKPKTPSLNGKTLREALAALITKTA